MDALNVFDIQRRRQIIDHRVEQRLNALVLKRRAAADRNERLVQRALADQLFQRCDIWLFSIEIGHHRVIVLIDNKLDQIVAIFFGFIEQISRNFFIEEFSAKRFVFPDDSAHFDQIDQSLKISFKADWNVQHRRLCTQAIDDRLHAIFEVRAGAIQLVDKAHARHAVFIGLTPYGFRLRLNASNAIKTSNRTVKHAERTFNFNREVNMARGVDDVDAVIVPETSSSRRRDRNPALLLLLHPIHRRCAIMHFANFIRFTGIKQDAFSRCGFTRIDVRHDADIAIHAEVMAACHSLYSS